MKNEEKNQINIPTPAVIGIILVVGLFIVLLFNPFYIVSAGERAIVLDFGRPQDVAVTEGLHFRTPIVQSIVKMDIRTQKYEADLSAASKDLQPRTNLNKLSLKQNSSWQ